ncbi:MAG: hypothetical protein O2829_10710 [Bacteroidetes bacterium]|nr:hypothetical protein [Bacteroidota bacterium]
MKRYTLLIALLFSSVIAFAQNNVSFSSKIFSKIDKIPEFESALKAHIEKYHSKDWRWNVWQVQSGPDYGGYMISEYPVSWDQVDKRGDLGSAHMTDWNKNVLVHVREVGLASYGEFKAELSTVALTDYADKIMIEYQISNPGKVSANRAMLEKLKKVWVEGNESVGVYEQVGSGEPKFVIVTRFKDGLKVLSDDNQQAMSERFNEVYGEGSFNSFLNSYSQNIESRWSEILYKRVDLSYKGK